MFILSVLKALNIQETFEWNVQEAVEWNDKLMEAFKKISKLINVATLKRKGSRYK